MKNLMHKIPWQTIAFAICLLFSAAQSKAACTATILTYPYSTNFDTEVNGPPSCFPAIGLVTPGWNNVGGDDKDWCPRNVPTPTPGTGPVADHTGGGRYLYMEATACFNKRAFLESPCFDLSPLDFPQVEFWYHMNGIDIGDLNLLVSTDAGMTWSPPVFSRFGPQGPGWKNAVIDLSAYAGMNIQLRFEGRTGGGDFSDIALDDISIYEKPCGLVVNSFPYIASFSGEVTGGTNCNDVINLVEPGWTNPMQDQKDWTTRSGTTPTTFTGPSADHTGGGHYLYTEATSCYNQHARLLSPCFDLSTLTSPQLRFWYHMNGFAMGNMFVHISTNEGKTWSPALWTMAGNQGSSWHQAVVDLSAYTGLSIKIRFDGVTGTGSRSDMALDDIEVLSGVPPIVGSDYISYSATDMDALYDGRLRISKPDGAHLATCDETIEKAWLYARLGSGKDYRFGDNPFESWVKINLDGLDAGRATVMTKNLDTLRIQEDQPESWYRTDITSLWATMDSIDVEIVDYDGGSYAPLLDSLKLELFVVPEYSVAALHASTPTTSLISSMATNSSSPATFSWNCDCDFPLYQFQLLRLYNHALTHKNDENNVALEIDWEQALTIETAEKEISLTPNQGQGFYVWRVRPIANQYAGLIADDRNWGVWSASPVDGSTVSYSNPTGSAIAFFYTDPNDSINRMLGRLFAESELKVETASFFNQLLKEQQSQKLRFSEETVIAGQSLYDLSGRKALKSMEAPINQNYLGFLPDFLKDEHGDIYSVENFDVDATYDDPDSAFGAPGAYFGDANPDLTVPDAQGFPFARTNFYNDGTGRVKEQSANGPAFRTGSGRTQRIYYAGVEDDELTRIFGDEAPKSATTYKQITINPNQAARVNYIGKDGNTLASCLSRNSAQTALDTLEYSEVYTVADTVWENSYYGDYGIQSLKPITLIEATEVTIDYHIDPGFVEAVCGTYCSTCDYTIYLFVHHLDDTANTTIDTLSLPAETCSGDDATGLTVTYFLNPGRYTIEKRLFTNNIIEGSVTATNTLGTSWLEYHLGNVSDSLDTLFHYSLSTAIEYLDSVDLDGFYTYLGSNADSIEADTLWRIYAGCDTVVIPLVECGDYDCTSSFPGFRGLL